jgi:hypothetical protein
MLVVDWLAYYPFILGSFIEFYFKSGDYEALAVLPEGSLLIFSRLDDPAFFKFDLAYNTLFAGNGI